MASTKGGSVYVELVLDKEQFDKDFKAAGREVAAVQKQLSLEMQRNKVKFAVDNMEQGWADKLFGQIVPALQAPAGQVTTVVAKGPLLELTEQLQAQGLGLGGGTVAVGQQGEQVA